MQGKSFVTPRPGSGGLKIRSEPRVDRATDVGDLGEGKQLDLVEQGAEWHACRVYVSSLVAEVKDGKFVVPKINWATVNIRSAPVQDATTDVGDLNRVQRLEFIERSGDWLIASDDGLQVVNPFSQQVVETPRVGPSFMKIERVRLPGFDDTVPAPDWAKPSLKAMKRNVSSGQGAIARWKSLTR